MKQINTLVHKLRHWEFWPMQAVYYPLFPLWLFLALKSRSFFFFNAANPLITNGGMAMESKNDIYKLIPKEYIPTTLFFKEGIHADTILKACEAEFIIYPFIIKPDIGMKGLGVAKIKNKKQLQNYLSNTTGDYIVQEYIAYEKEVGIFYVRKPGDAFGTITGIVSKEFLTVTGDGTNTILQLLNATPRGKFQALRLKKIYGKGIDEILPKGKQKIVMPFGSHTLGAKFLDHSTKICPELIARLNNICNKIPEFYYGRLDIKLTNLEDLTAGKNFSIIELNGAGSEPTHIYDPKHSLWYAWKQIAKHWILLQKISEANMAKGFKYLSRKEGFAMLQQNSLLEKQLRQL